MIKLKDILNETSIASWSDDKKTLRWKVYIDGEKEPLILTGRSANEVKKFAHQMINNNKVKIKRIVKEGKLTEKKSSTEHKWFLKTMKECSVWLKDVGMTIDAKAVDKVIKRIKRLISNQGSLAKSTRGGKYESND